MAPTVLPRRRPLRGGNHGGTEGGATEMTKLCWLGGREELCCNSGDSWMAICCCLIAGILRTVFLEEIINVYNLIFEKMHYAFRNS